MNDGGVERGGGALGWQSVALIIQAVLMLFLLADNSGFSPINNNSTSAAPHSARSLVAASASAKLGAALPSSHVMQVMHVTQFCSPIPVLRAHSFQLYEIVPSSRGPQHDSLGPSI